MGASLPPIGVKFTGDTDGVAVAVRELTTQIRGLSSVQRQNALASDAMAASGKKVAAQFGQAGAALGALGTTIGVARLTGLLTDAIDTGDAIFKLSQKTGASTEALSVLAFAGRTAEVSLEDLGTLLKFLSKSLGELQRGDPSTVSAFRAIGLEAKDLKGLSVDQALLKIADAQARFADGAGKAEASLRIFGRAGTEIIPLLNDLAGGGFDRAAEAAKRLNLVWTRESAKAAQDFNDSITLMKASLAGLAGELTKDAVPDLTRLATNAANAIGELPGPLKEVIANLVGIEAGVVGVASAIRLLSLAGVFTAFTNPFALAALAIGAVAAILVTFAGNAARAKAEYTSFVDTLKDTASIDTEQKRLELALAANSAAIDATNSDFRRLALVKQRQRIEEQLAQLQARRTVVAAPNRPDVVVPDPAVLAARRAAAKAAIDQELQLAQERNQADQQANQQQFDRGLEGIKDYYRRRIGLTQEGIDAELRAIEAERKLIRATPAANAAEQVKKDADLKAGGRLDQQVLKVRTDGEVKIAELREKDRLDERALAEERLGFEQKILQARGQTLQATLDGLEQEARKFDELLAKQGVPRPERQQRVGEFRTALTLRANVDDLTGQAQQAFAEIDAERTRIDQEVEIGVLTQRQGQQQLANLEQARLPALREMATQIRAFAEQVGDPALIQSAAQLGLQVEGIAASANLAAQRAARLGAELGSAAERSVATFLGSGLDQLGQPNENSGAIAVRQREAEEVRRQIDEANAAAAQGDVAAAGRVQQLTAEYARLQGKIADLKSETFGLDDAFKAFFHDLIDGIRQAINELIATDLVDKFRGALNSRGNPAGELVANDFGLTAPATLGAVASQAPQLLGTAADTAKLAQETAAAAALTGAGAASAAALGVSAAGLSGAAAAQLGAAAALLAAAQVLATAGLVPGFTEGGLVAGGGGRRGPGDTVLAWHDPLEFIVNPHATRRPGILPLLRAVNAGLEIPGFAAGGLVGGIRASAAFPVVRLPAAPRATQVAPGAALAGSLQKLSGELRVHLEQGLLLDTVRSYLRTGEGEELMLRAVARNPNTVRDALDNG